MHTPSFLTTSLFLLQALATPILQARTPQTCNGHAALCDRQYSNITFIGAHDSPFVGSPDDLASNQNVDVQAQLNAGIRFLSAQANDNLLGELDFCHTYCWEYDAGPIATYLGQIKEWMDANPDNVVTLLLVNGGFYNVSVYDSAFQSTGLAQMAYIPPSNPLEMHQWPTLSQMITNNQRLVVFMDYDANTTLVPYILPEFSNYYFETPYDTTDPTFPECSINRPSGLDSAEGWMYGMNHFLDSSVFGSSILVPDNNMDAQTNAATGPGSIGAQADLCAGLHGRYPNFVLVDRFDVGEVFQAQFAMNFPGGNASVAGGY